MTRAASTRDSTTPILTTLVPSAAGCAVCFRSRVRKRTRADREQCQKLPKTFRVCQITCSEDRNCRWMKRCGRGSSVSAERDLSFRKFGNVSPVHGQAARERLNSVVRVLSGPPVPIVRAIARSPKKSTFPWARYVNFEWHTQARCPTTHLLFSQRKCGTLPVGNQNGGAMKQKTDVLQGTLALMVLKTLDVLGSLHCYGVARRIEQISGDLLAVNQGTLYPVLLKL